MPRCLPQLSDIVAGAGAREEVVVQQHDDASLRALVDELRHDGQDRLVAERRVAAAVDARARHCGIVADRVQREGHSDRVEGVVLEEVEEARKGHVAPKAVRRASGCLEAHPVDA